jgi:hypothetical protein
VLLAAGSISSANAQAPVSSLAESLHGAAKDAYDAAKLLEMNGDFGGALVKFRDSYELSKDPRLLWNMAACEKNLRHYYRAKVLMTRYLRDVGTLATPERRRSGEEFLVALRPLVSSIEFHVNAAGASVMVDGEVVGTTPLREPVGMDLGSHRLQVQKEGYRLYQQVVDLSGGTSQVVEVSLVPVAKAAKEPEVVPQPPATGGRTMKTIGLVGAATGVVGIGIGTVFGLRAMSKLSDSKQFCSGDTCDAQGVSLRDESRSAGTIATVSMIAGGLLTVGGVVLWLTAPSGSEVPRQGLERSIRVTPTAMGIQVEGRW